MIQVLNRALNILEYIAKNPKEPHSLSEIANHLDINSSTCANIIKTLVNRNYLEQESKKKGYRLGSMSYYITNNFTYKTELIEAADKPMQELRETTNEGCILAILRGDTRIIIHEKKSQSELQVVNYPKKNAYATSTGRLILSYFDEKDLRKFVNRYGLPPGEVWKGVNSIEDLLEETSKVRERGICIQESSAHIIGLAVPIWRGDDMVASLGLYMPSMRLREEIRDDVTNQLKLAGQKINEKIEDMQELRSLSVNADTSN